ncbi:site-specific integrase [Thermus scotoductus]|uniref:Site-specific integrase n=1 Tax=Thermus scotoductus TaxID=37636 RepID=A0A430SCQ9_THESC|nr:site-specific integrase [Thermus scotoductus]RTG97207.1 site-specific integrase [Thermus scotoductus]RTH07939.1 site-specific integrase [Thermus scotoductus]RTH12257.1 site-specific integrase [Thermus scotoductus]RTH14024.1 site-specific integrase [Thermus scotoductus]RTH14560.1 site-specific integrase [Thermus scotoductus]
MKRRGKGGGSVFYHEGKGKWVAQLTWIDPATGRKLKREKHCATRKEAEQALAQMVAEQARGLLMDPSRLTTRDFALEYLKRLEREGLRPNSIRLALDELAHALPSLKDPKAHDPLGRMRLQEVKPVHVRAAVDRVIEAGYAPRTVARVLMRLKALFREALRLELVARNPAEAIQVRLPKGEKAARALEPEEVARLLEAAEASRSRDMALLLRLMLETGLRRGEALALQWGDVDLERGEVRVWRAWAKVGSKGAFTPLKTPTAKRVVPLPLGLLRRLKARKEELLERLNPEEVDGLHLVGGVKPVDPDAFNHYLRRLAEKAGLGRVRVHDLRHTWATLALSRGVPLEVVSERLGHASPTITLNVYRHLLEEERRGYVLDLEDLLFPGPRAIS